MSDYFDDPSNEARLRAEVRKWMGTPFVEAVGPAARPGVAADCVSFCEKVLTGCGAIRPVQWPARYVTFGGGREMLVIFLKIMEGIEELQIVWDRKRSLAVRPKVGDLVLSSSGAALHHLAIYMGQNVIVHCLQTGRGGVQEGNLFDPIIYNNVFAIYRCTHG